MDPQEHGQRYGLPGRRDAVIELLVQAYAEGQIDLEDYESRVELANRAETVEELEKVIHDFPDYRRAIGREPEISSSEYLPAADAHTETKIAVIGDHTLSHEDFAGQRVRTVALIGDVKVHLESAPPSSPPFTIAVYSVIGDTTIVIPRGMRVKNRMINVLGDVEVRRNEDSRVDGTRGLCVLEGFAVIGDVTIVEEGYRKKGFFRKLVDR